MTRIGSRIGTLMGRFERPIFVFGTATEPVPPKAGTGGAAGTAHASAGWGRIETATAGRERRAGRSFAMNQDLLRIVDGICREKNIDREGFLLDLETAMSSAVKKIYETED